MLINIIMSIVNWLLIDDNIDIDKKYWIKYTYLILSLKKFDYKKLFFHFSFKSIAKLLGI